ncbi:helix-turn-helix domain-containing protein [Enterococcus faecium]|nr:helix-turn-helix domain-containing protein [Enterococcus faecium]MDV7858965.1 helix-turn-helix domain-containing protein [Enterococcus faecium]
MEYPTNQRVLETDFYPYLQKKLEEYTDRLLAMAQLPLVLTNTDLKRLFQISDSTLNRLVKLGDFPSCWYGIRGYYLRDDVLEWMRKSDADGFREQMRLLRSL